MVKPSLGIFVSVVLAVATLAVPGQRDSAERSFAQRDAEIVPLRAHAGGAVLREIDDLSTGDRWFLERDVSHPGGPGLWMLIAARKAREETGVSRAGSGASNALTPVIHAGDEVTVEEHSNILDARLQAVALGSAAAGAEFRARLKIGGIVIDAVALKPGYAVFAMESGRWR